MLLQHSWPAVSAFPRQSRQSGMAHSRQLLRRLVLCLAVVDVGSLKRIESNLSCAARTSVAQISELDNVDAVMACRGFIDLMDGLADTINQLKQDPLPASCPFVVPRHGI